MPNYGEKRLHWETDAGQQGGINIQITDVSKVLASVGKICSAGNRVVFEPDGGYIENLNTGGKTSLRKDGAVYKLDVWIRARNAEDQVNAIETTEQGFTWQDTLP